MNNQQHTSQPVQIIGLGMSPTDLTAAHLDLIRRADILVAGERHLAFFADLNMQKKVIDKHLGALAEFIRQERDAGKAVVVVASGDPLYYGIGAYLSRTLGPGNIRIHPNVSTAAAAFARIGEPWHQATVVSLHGRSRKDDVLSAMNTGKTIGVYTDPVETPAALGAFIQQKGCPYRLCVFEELGSPGERIRWFSPAESIGESFATPNFVILKPAPGLEVVKRKPFIGMPDNWFVHENGLITKAEVRAVAISKLRLARDHVLWDIGAGSGAVSIEASTLVPGGKVVAVEQYEDRVEQIHRNKTTFGVENLLIRHATAPDCLPHLPRPDRVFVGGGGRHLDRILKTAAEFLRPGGGITVNTVIIRNIDRTAILLTELGFETETVQVQINRSRAMPWGDRLQSQNPVWIISGHRSG
ncbi:MAG: precorrin-6y C5,15-methyltransferase (decarboxylating) subunit CbiE [Desulfobacteraceae bacterium]|nr:precorrin-6y C5,15-methyltransferase (decarboxylating) subunit CbiE [Desulfobacteraceae bacterium]